MAHGRKFIIRHSHRNRTNRFTADTYDAVCSVIEWANIDANKKNVIVKHNKGDMAAVASLVTDVLKQNNIKVKDYKKYASTNVKTLFYFNSKEDASKARDIINRMVDDTVNRSAVTTGGENTTSNGVKIKVDLKKDENGNVSLQSGTNFIPSGSESAASASAETSSGNRRWLIIGGVAVVALLAVLVVLKKKKIL